MTLKFPSQDVRSHPSSVGSTRGARRGPPSARLTLVRLTLGATAVLGLVGWTSVHEPTQRTTQGAQGLDVGAPSAARLQEDAPGEAPPEHASDCISHTTSVRYVMGYDHLVHLESECSRMALCDVRTDVSQQTVETTVPPGGSKTVVTFRGSPARVFEATVDCRFATD